jgi:hypothetical protein
VMAAQHRCKRMLATTGTNDTNLHQTVKFKY